MDELYAVVSENAEILGYFGTFEEACDYISYEDDYEVDYIFDCENEDDFGYIDEVARDINRYSRPQNCVSYTHIEMIRF
jgi:hypothetical protein